MAIRRGVLVALLLVAVLACARESVPTELIGRWTSDDPRYADRSLEISMQQVVFGTGPGMRMTYRAKGIERQTDPVGVLYEIYYDMPGDAELSLRVRLPSPGHLRIENHSELWTRAAAAPSAGG